MKKIALYIICLLTAYNIHAQNISVSGPFSGLNNTDSSITLDNGEAQDTLNVEVSQDSLALKKRQGYSLISTLDITTSPIRGSISFKTSSGNNIKLFAHDQFLSKSENGGAYTNIYTTAPVGGRWSFCASDGKAYAFNSSTYSFTPFSYDGSALTYYPSMPKASLCAMTVDRMLLAGTTDQPNRLYFSRSGDVTDFIVDIDPEDPGFEDIGLPGEKITNIFTTQAEWLVFKTNSMTSYQGTNQFDLVPSVISEKIGMVEPNAIVQHEGAVYFKSTDGKIYGYVSGTLTELSKKISGIVTNMTRDTLNTQVYTDKSHFDTGVFSNTSSSITAGDVEPLHYVSTDTLYADFNSGTLDSSISISDSISLTVNISSSLGTWSSGDSFGIGSFNQGMAFGNGRFVAVGVKSGASQTLINSADGISWSTQSVATSLFVDVVYANGMFVAVANSGTNRVIKSVNGTSWTMYSASENNAWQTITYGNGLFVAAASDGTHRIMTSPDGENWTNRSQSSDYQWITSAYGAGKFIVVANNSDKYMISSDGISWADGVLPISCRRIFFGNDRFVAVSVSGKFAYSLDGTNWSLSDTTMGNYWYGGTYYNGLYLVPGINGTYRVATSTDAVTWNISDNTIAERWSALECGNNKCATVSLDGMTAASDFTIYEVTGSFISRDHLVGGTLGQNKYGYINYTSTVPTGTQVDYFVRHSSSTTGIFTSWAATTSYLLLSSTDTVWEYRTDLYKTTASFASPTIYDVTLLFETTGYWETPEISMGGVTSWGLFNADSTLDGSATLTYKIAVSSYSGGTANASLESLTPGSLITASTGTYSKVRVTNSFTSATETVRMDNLSYSWSRSPDKMANAFEYKGDIYFAVPYNNSLSNNRLLKLDTKNNGWNIFDIPVNSPLSIDEYVYFGSPTGGYIYQYPVGDSDNGSAINSYWKSKNYIGTNPYVEKQFEKMSLILGSDYGSSLDVTYTMDTATSTTFSVALTSSTANFVRNNRQLPIGERGAFFNLQIGNNALNQPFSFYGANIDYKDEPWIVSE